jgi:ATP-dependent protease ClpP protease subunit
MPLATHHLAAAEISNIATPQFQTAAADRLVLRSGKRIEGEVIAEDGSTVTVEVLVPPGYTIRRRVNKAEIASRLRPPRTGVPYVLIPVIGEIGKDVTVDALRAGIDKARAAKPRYIVLAIDSPGGEISQMAGMVDLLIDASKDVETVAYVKQAYSAAAVIAMCCREVYMKPDAVIGAAVPFAMTENGPADVDAKFRSAFEAKIRASTAHGGHADLLIRGMSELDLQIFVATENGKPVLHTSGPGKMVKSSGQILTLTAGEAQQCGLAHVATGMTDLGGLVAGCPWYECSDRAWNAVIATVALQRQREWDQLEQRRRFLARQSAIAVVKPEWEAIEHRIAELLPKAAANADAVKNLNAQCNSELLQIENEYQQALAIARYQADPAAAVARALEVRNARAAETRQNWQASVAALQSTGEAAALEVGQLRARERVLLASIPPE